LKLLQARCDPACELRLVFAGDSEKSCSFFKIFAQAFRDDGFVPITSRPGRTTTSHLKPLKAHRDFVRCQAIGLGVRVRKIVQLFKTLDGPVGSIDFVPITTRSGRDAIASVQLSKSALCLRVVPQQ
jgi:hypothetical protein